MSPSPSVAPDDPVPPSWADDEVDDDTPKEACGVFGVYAPGHPVSHLTYLGLYALQHRGQESAGMAVSDGETITVVKDMGLVSNVFDERTLATLTGHLAVGHTRYSTTGSSNWRNAQPVYRDVAAHTFALGHNGNLTNTEALAEDAGMLPGTVSSDSDVVAELIANELGRHPEASSDGRALERALIEVLPTLEGAFSFVLMDEGHVVGVRDPHGFRPLCLGKLDNGWVLASESPALDVVGAHFVREVEPGDDHHRRQRLSVGAGIHGGPGRPETVPVRVRLLRPPRHDALRPERASGPGAHGRAAGRAGAG